MKTKNIAFITKFSWVGNAPSVINSALFWESKGYQVDIYAEKPNQIHFPLPIFIGKRITFITTIINDKKFILDDFFFRKTHFQKNKYKWVIGFDHSGLIRGGISILFSSTKLIYHSLEFFEPEKKTIGNKIIKFCEIFFSFKAKYIFAQDNYRFRFLAGNLHQNLNKFRNIYNSPCGISMPGMSSYFRDLFAIHHLKKIVLCVGSLIQEHCVLDLIESIDSWDDQFVLVLHGWFPYPNIKQRAINKKNECPEKLFISEKLFHTEEKYIAFQSCDIGFVGFKSINNNVMLAAGSAGKIFDFMMTGVPMVAINSPGMKEIIQVNKIGVVVDDINEINNALKYITLNHVSLKRNALNTFKYYEFNNQYETVYNSMK